MIKKILKIFLIVFSVASLVFLGYYVFSKSDESGEVFEIDSTYSTDIVRKAVATGAIIPRKEIDIKSQVSGVVQKLYIEAGEYVKKGQLIAKIQIIPDVVSLNNAEARLKEANINFRNAEKELDRQKKLFAQKVISEMDYNRFYLDFELNKQQVETAESNMELVKEGASKRSGVVSNLVKSTVNGMVLNVPVKEGNFVTETNTFNDGTTIASVADMKEMIFEGKVDEAEVGKLKENMPLKLQVGALDSVEFQAYLEYISPKGVEEDGAIQFEIRANIQLRSDHFLRAGYSANADIVLEEKKQVLAIKESNLIFEEDQVFVEIEKEKEVFEKVKIVTGISDGINIEVKEGLTKESKIKKQTGKS